MTQIQLRRATATAWTSANPVLALGEVGLETDTRKLKVGDGVSLWNALGYYVPVWSELTDLPSYLTAGGGQANGYATLDANARVPASQLPNSIMEYQGTWNASTNSPTLADGDGSAHTGNVYRVSTGGSRNLGSGSITFNVGDYVIYNGTAWEKSDTTDAVSTVAGRTGDVTLTASDINATGTPSSTTYLRGDNTWAVASTKPRVGSTASSATPSIDCGLYDQYNITALAANITSVTITGTPSDGQRLLIRIKDDGTARTIAWGSQFTSSGVAALLAYTSALKTHFVGLLWDSVAAKWVCVGSDLLGY